jgi:hypothetical protein
VLVVWLELACMVFALPAAPRTVLVEFEDQVIEKLNLCAGFGFANAERSRR